MAKPVFYHATIKKLIVAFGTIFDDIKITDGYGREIPVPLHYSPRAKWLESIQSNSDLDTSIVDRVLPALGFEMVGLSFAPERHLNPLSKFDDRFADSDAANQFMYNRVPYDFQFELNIATVRYEDTLKIVEQILPFFNPELTVTINDMEQFNNPTNIPIVLNSSSIQMDYEGTMDTRRTILSNLQFTVKGYLYSNVRNAQRIKKSIMDFHQEDFDRIFTRFTAEVVPFEANASDPHEIIESITTELMDDE